MINFILVLDAMYHFTSSESQPSVHAANEHINYIYPPCWSPIFRVESVNINTNKTLASLRRRLMLSLAVFHHNLSTTKPAIMFWHKQINEVINTTRCNLSLYWALFESKKDLIDGTHVKGASIHKASVFPRLRLT